VDFGLAPTPLPRNRPVDQKRFEVSGTLQLTASKLTAASEGSSRLGTADTMTFHEAMMSAALPAPDSFLESPRRMKHLGLKSAPTNLGFVYPNSHKDLKRPSTESSKDTIPYQRGEYHPLCHSVMAAQYSKSGTYHCI